MSREKNVYVVLARVLSFYIFEQLNTVKRFLCDLPREHGNRVTQDRWSQDTVKPVLCDPPWEH